MLKGLPGLYNFSRQVNNFSKQKNWWGHRQRASRGWLGTPPLQSRDPLPPMSRLNLLYPASHRRLAELATRTCADSGVLEGGAFGGDIQGSNGGGGGGPLGGVPGGGGPGGGGGASSSDMYPAWELELGLGWIVKLTWVCSAI